METAKNNPKRPMALFLRVPTRFGNFVLEATEHGVKRLHFPGKRPRQDIRAITASHRTRARKAKGHLRAAAALLHRYFQGEPEDFSGLALDLSGATCFEQKVLKQLRRVPNGRVCSYGALALRSGYPGAARAVGSVMRKNKLPVILPCHRVLSANGKPGGYSQGLSWKRRLLALEKAEFHGGVCAPKSRARSPESGFAL